MRVCECHGEPMYAHREPRNISGLTYRCAVIHRQRVRDRHQRDMNDPVYRNERRMRQARQKRLKTLDKRDRLSPITGRYLVAVRKGAEDPDG